MAAGAADDWQEYRQQPPYRYAALQKHLLSRVIDSPRLFCSLIVRCHIGDRDAR
jgi:hypothetical protein